MEKISSWATLQLGIAMVRQRVKTSSHSPDVDQTCAHAHTLQVLYISEKRCQSQAGY